MLDFTRDTVLRWSKNTRQQLVVLKYRNFRFQFATSKFLTGSKDTTDKLLRRKCLHKINGLLMSVHRIIHPTPLPSKENKNNSIKNNELPPPPPRALNTKNRTTSATTYQSPSCITINMQFPLKYCYEYDIHAFPLEIVIPTKKNSYSSSTLRPKIY